MARYEGSKADIRRDKAGAKKRGMSMKAYEKTAEDRREDKKYQAKMDRKKK